MWFHLDNSALTTAVDVAKSDSCLSLLPKELADCSTAALVFPAKVG